MNNLILLGVALLGVTAYKQLGYPVSDWIFVLTAIMFVFYLMSTNKAVILKTPPFFTVMMLFVFLFYFGAMFSSYNSSDIVKSIINSQRLLLVFIIVPLMFSLCFRVPKSLDYLFAAVAFNGVVLGLSAFFQYIGWYGLSHIEESRISGITNHPNELGIIAAISFIFGFYFIITGRKLLGLKAYGVVSCMLSLVAVFLSSSFTALAVLVGVVFSAYLLMGELNKLKTYIQFFVVIMIVVMVVFLLSVGKGGGYQGYDDRVSVVGEKSVGTRVNTYLKAIDVIRHSPFVGKGMAFDDRRVGDYQVHNMYLLSWYCAGILGLIGSIGVMLTPLFVYFSNRHKSWLRKDKAMLSCSLSAVIGSMLVTMVAPNMFEITTYFTLFVWCAVSVYLYKNSNNTLIIKKYNLASE